MAKILPLISAVVAGTISLAGMAQCAPGTTAVTVYFSDFEADDGGLVADPLTDWEHGEIPVLITGSNCDSSPESPGGAYSGTNGWATNLDDCYMNQQPSAFNTVDLVVDLSDPDFVSAELSMSHWFEVFTNFDYLVITANGAEIYRNDTTENSNGWLTLRTSLTPFLGQASVTLSFKLWATTVVNRAGWYIDDVRVTACVTDGTIGIADVDGASFQAWPVPATEQLHVQPASDAGVVRAWALYDAIGRVLASGERADAAQFAVDVSRFHGPAVLELRTGAGVQRQQVVLH